METKVCRRNKYGYCRYGERCHFRHEKKICNNYNCNIFDCEKRHPRECWWFQEYRRCKFTSFCKFKHTEIKNLEEIISKMEYNKEKIAEIDIMLQKLETYDHHIKSKIFKLLEEKDTKIAELEASLQITRNSLEKFVAEKDMELEIDVKKSGAPISKLKCSVCGYLAKSSSGLRLHINRKHTKYDENVTTFQCEDCGDKFGSAEDLKEHMITHSYQKCNECNQTFLHLDDIGKHMRNMHGEYGSLSHFKWQLFNHEY